MNKKEFVFRLENNDENQSHEKITIKKTENCKER